MRILKIKFNKNNNKNNNQFNIYSQFIMKY